MKYIILVDVENGAIDRTDLENIEDLEFETIDELQDTLKTTDIEVYTLSEFMDIWNNQDVSPDNNWLGYVNIKEKSDD